MAASRPPASTACAEGAEITLAATITTKWKAFKSNYVDSDTVTQLGVPTFSPPSGAYASGQAVTVASPSGQVKVLQSYPNLLDASVWQTNTWGSQGTFARCGQVTENTVEMRPTPPGSWDKVWVAYNDAAEDADGGWTTGSFPVDKTKLYRFSAWMRRVDTTPAGTSGSSHSYLACGASTVSTLTGTTTDSVTDSPYFAHALLAANEWHLMVGYVHPAGDLTTTHSARIYNSLGQAVATGVDFRWLTNSTTSSHRAFLYYCTEVGIEHEFWNPRVEVVNSVTDPIDVLFATPESSPKTITLTGTGARTIQALRYSSTASILSSGVATAIYTIKVSAPTISPDGGTFTGSVNVTLSTTTTGATIYYTTNGAEPTSGSTPYTVPFAMNQSGVVKAKALKSGMPDSDTTTSAPFTVNANTPPTISEIQDASINWNSSVGIGFTVGDAETPNNLTVTATSSNIDLLPDTGITVSGTGASRTISLEPGPDQFGSTTVTVAVADPGGLSATDTFVLTVNSAPTISEIADQTVISGLAVGPVSFTVKDWETPAGDLTVSASSSNTGLVPNANIILGGTGGERTITVVPVAGQTGTAAITVSVSNGAATTTEAFAVVVSASSACEGTASPRVRVANYHQTQNDVRLTVFTEGGAPEDMAILVNSESFATASWGPFNPAPTLTLPSDGAYNVWVGVRCSDTDSGRWTRAKLLVDRVAPTLQEVNFEPSQGLTPNPVLRGHCLEDLSSVTFDITGPNSEVICRGRRAVLQRSQLNETTFVYGRTDFECVGLNLKPGQNTIRVHATDLDGHQTDGTFTYTVNYSLDSVVPSLTITSPTIPSPPATVLISGEEFAVQGAVQDIESISGILCTNSASVSVRAVIVSIVDGTTLTRELFGSVSRSGQFQIVHIPMSPGDNTLTVYATDPAGHVTQQQLTLTPSVVQLVMDPIELPEPLGPVTVSGTVTVTDPAQSVSVNGVAAPVTVEGGVGYWSAVVPLPEDEAVIFVATATSAGAARAQAAKDKVLPPRAYVGSYSFSQDWWTDDPKAVWKKVTCSLSWDGDPDDVSLSSGSAVVESTHRDNHVQEQFYQWEEGQIMGDLTVYEDGVLVTDDPNSQPRPNVGPVYFWDIASEQCEAGKAEWDIDGYFSFWRRSVKSTLKVFTGTRPQDRPAWFLTLAAGGTTYDPDYLAEHVPSGAPGWLPVSGRTLTTSEITVDGKQLYCDGVRFDMYPKNRHIDVTPRVKDNEWYRVPVTPAWPPLYVMDRMYHPGKGNSLLQPMFDEAAGFLGDDDDPGDPPCMGIVDFLTDDVPYYSDFYIINDKKPLVMDGILGTDEYNHIMTPTAQILVELIGTHIKQVSSLPEDHGTTVLGSSIICKLNHPNIILAGDWNLLPAVCAHEWGHSRCLDDASEESRKRRAIMYLNPVDFESRNQINRAEHDVLLGTEPVRPPEP